MTRHPFGKSPFHRLLGLELHERSGRHAETRMPVRPEYLQEEGVVQGGLLSCLADATAVALFHPDLPPERTMTSVEFKVNFVRPATLEAGELRARAELVRQGRRLGVARSTVFQAGRPVLEGLFTYLFFDSERGDAREAPDIAQEGAP